jgi:NADH dehydrogenase/NADH:ubiquinone oxidoreductase subunit G
MMVKIQVDGKKIEAEEGMTLLQACLDKGIFIPNLCYLEAMKEPPASCRLCFVEIEGNGGPVPSCTVRVSQGMVVRTDTAAVRRLQKSAFRLFMSVHDVDCGDCPANKKCDLQRIAKFLRVGLKPGKLDLFLKEPRIVQDHPFLDHYPNRCVLCGRCVHACRSRHDRPLMTFARRGFNTVISLYGGADSPDSSCETCLACVEVCPVAALTLKGQGSPGETIGS